MILAILYTATYQPILDPCYCWWWQWRVNGFQYVEYSKRSLGDPQER
jgi:hypothetical protein